MSCHFRGVQWIRRGKIFEWKRGRDPYFVNVMFFFSARPGIFKVCWCFGRAHRAERRVLREKEEQRSMVYMCCDFWTQHVKDKAAFLTLVNISRI